MNFLVLVNELEKEYTANNKIIFNICDELERQGNRCFYVSVNDYAVPEETTVIDGRQVRLFSRNTKLAEIRKRKNSSSLNASKYLYHLLHPCAAWKMFKYKKYDYIESLDSLYRLIHDKKIDCLFFYYFPFFFTHEVLSRIDTDRLKLLYQMDPWGHHELFPKETILKRKEEETSMFHKADLIVTTPLLHKCYETDLLYLPYLDKIISLNFPNLKTESKHNTESDTNEKDGYELYFLGTIDDEYRSPKPFLDYVESVRMEFALPIDLYFVGSANSAVLQDYSQRCDYIHLMKSVDHDAYEEILSKPGHFLLNINNTITNQMPSKIIDYVSSGNPIVNVVKNEDDCTIDLLKAYPLKYHFYEQCKNDAKDFVAFLKTSKNRNADHTQIMNDYAAFSPAYVTKEILRNIEKIRKK